MTRVSPFSTLLVAGHAIGEILRISIPAVTKASFRGLEVEEADKELRAWAGRLLKRVKIELEVFGAGSLSVDRGPYVVVSNHQSLYDIPILFQALPLSLRMAGKKELFSIPIWGRAMSAAGFVEIDRSNRSKAYAALQEAGARMSEQGISLFIAPEGTRSRDGKVQTFKRGAFTVAKSMGFRVLPVAIDGAISVHRSGEKSVSLNEKVTVTILDSVSPSDFASVEAMSASVRESIIASLAQ